MLIEVDNDVPVDASPGGYVELLKGAHDFVNGFELLRFIEYLRKLATHFFVLPRLLEASCENSLCP